MGNMASKRENSESVGKPSGSVGKRDFHDRLEAFIKGGDCKEVYTVFEDCVEEAEKKKEHPDKCFPMLLSCMEAHPDYYRPILEARKTAGVKVKRDFDAFWSELGDSSEAFMEGGGCKESFKAWDDCMKDSKKKNGRMVKCYECFPVLLSCMETRPEYYQPFLERNEIGRQNMKKELEALFPE